MRRKNNPWIVYLTVCCCMVLGADFAAAQESDLITAFFPVSGMYGEGCEVAVEGAVNRLQGVGKVRASTADAHAEVVFDPAQVEPETIRATIAGLGYDAKLPGNSEPEESAAALQASEVPPPGERQFDISVASGQCGYGRSQFEEALLKIPGVEDVWAPSSSEDLRLEYDPETTSPDEIVAAFNSQAEGFTIRALSAPASPDAE